MRISGWDICSKEENLSVVEHQGGCGYSDDKYRKWRWNGWLEIGVLIRVSMKELCQSAPDILPPPCSAFALRECVSEELLVQCSWKDRSLKPRIWGYHSLEGIWKFRSGQLRDQVVIWTVCVAWRQDLSVGSSKGV